ncbi:MAG: hypothetical protein K2X81_06145 [Candidatus Obscuribacterales bacterium]|nr:hypothetical protein [Candidatus Obscuribacterales bacterium]
MTLTELADQFLMDTLQMEAAARHQDWDALSLAVENRSVYEQDLFHALRVDAALLDTHLREKLLTAVALSEHVMTVAREQHAILADEMQQERRVDRVQKAYRQ